MNNIMPIVLPKYETNESESGIVFTILDGSFSGAKFQFGTVSIAEPDKTKKNDGFATLSFDYSLTEDTLDGPSDSEIVDFRLTLGKILEQVISGFSEDNENTVTESEEIISVDDEVTKAYN